MPGYHLTMDGGVEVAAFSRTMNSPLSIGRRQLGASVAGDDRRRVSREQATLRVFIDGAVVLESVGRGRTGWRRGEDGEWTWLRRDESVRLEHGDQIALDHTLNAPFITFRHHHPPTAQVAGPPPPPSLLQTPQPQPQPAAGPSSSAEVELPPPAASPPGGLSQLSGDELAVILRACGSADNGWLLACALARCCRALRESVREWRQNDATELSFVGWGFDDNTLRRGILAGGGGRRLLALNVARNAQLTDAAVGDLVEAAPRLERLTLSTCQMVRGPCLLTLARSAAALSLAHLDLSSCRFVGEEAVLAVTAACTNLTLLDLSHVALALTDRVLRQCGRTLTRLATVGLRTLSHSASSGMGDDGLRALADGCGATLTSIDLDFCNALTDHGLADVARRCTGLRRLSPRRAPGWRRRRALAHCPHLEHVDLSATHTAPAALVRVVAACRSLECLHVDTTRTLTAAGWHDLASEAPPRLRRLSAVLASGLDDACLADLADRCDALREVRLGTACAARRCPTCKVVTGATTSRPSNRVCTHPNLTGGALTRLRAEHPRLTVVGGPQDPDAAAAGSRGGGQGQRKRRRHADRDRDVAVIID